MDNDSVQNDLNAMIDTFSGNEKVEEVVDEVETKEVNNDKNEEEVLGEEKKVVEEEKKVEESEPELDEKDKVIADLRKQLEESMIKKEEPEKKEDDKKEKENDKVKLEPITFENIDFIGDKDPEDILRDKDSFNQLLNDVFKKGVELSRNISTEGVLRAIPEIVKSNVELMASLKESSDDFYKNNPDLVPFKKVVAAVFEEMASKSPDKHFTELIKDVGPEARKRLGIAEKIKEKEKDTPPKLPQKKGSGKATPEKPSTEGLVDEIEAMNKSLGGN